MPDEVVVPEWAKEGLPESLHGVPFLKDTTSLEDFQGKLTHAAQHMGNSIRIPGPDANDDIWKEFRGKLDSKIPNLHQVDLTTEEGQLAMFTKMGRPADEKGYDAGEEHSWLAKVALDSDLTKGQFKTLVEKLGDVNKTRGEESALTRQTAIDTLFSQWGLAKPNKLTNINGLLELTGAPDAFKAEMKDGKADAATMAWLDSIAGQFAEVAKFKKDVNSPENITPEEARSQIQELMENPEYFKQTPQAMDLRKKMLELQKAANPSASEDISTLIASGPELMEMFEQS